jgi:RHS repeat-associated protein
MIDRRRGRRALGALLLLAAVFLPAVASAFIPRADLEPRYAAPAASPAPAPRTRLFELERLRLERVWRTLEQAEKPRLGDLGQIGDRVGFGGVQLQECVGVRACVYGGTRRVHLFFQGRELDPVTGLMDFRSRWYSPQLGRFLSRDPLGYPDGPNAYAAFLGDPVNHTDPMGLRSPNADDQAILDALTQRIGDLAGEYRQHGTCLGQPCNASKYQTYIDIQHHLVREYQDALYEADDDDIIVKFGTEDFFYYEDRAWLPTPITVAELEARDPTAEKVKFAIAVTAATAPGVIATFSPTGPRGSAGRLMARRPGLGGPARGRGGRGGGPDHARIQQEITVATRGEQEVPIMGSRRIADVVDDRGRIHQIGDMRSRSGYRPSARERAAIEDIRGAVGKDVTIIFHDKRGVGPSLIDPDLQPTWKPAPARLRKPASPR